jgi:hypothetical protein
VAFAVTAAHEHAYQEIIFLSEEGLYWGCKQVDGTKAPGTTFVAAADALARWGQPLQEEWPYDQFLTDADPLPVRPDTAADIGAWRKATLQPVSCNADTVKSHLDAGTSVVLGIRTGYEFQLSRDGRIPLPVSARRLTGLHAILAVGYTEDDVIFRNSWGDGWGDRGYGYLPFSYLAQYGLQAWAL